MENSLQIFSYKGTRVRTVERDGEVWFVAKDVCDVLELSNAREAISSLDEDEKNTVRISDGNRGNPTLNVINEPGLYALVFRSNKPEAKVFSRWVRHEVLPKIRKTGSYKLSMSTEDREYRQQELELKSKEFDLQRAKFLKDVLDNPPFPLTDETRTVFGHEVFRLTTSKDYLAMLPECSEKWYTAGDIGSLLGISANKVGRIAKKHGLKAPEGESNDYGRWIFSKSKYSSREVPSFIYSEAGLDWFTDYNNGICKEIERRCL